MIIPELDLGIYISGNTQTSAPLVASFSDQLLARVSATTPSPPRALPTASQLKTLRPFLDRLNGDYVSTRRAFSGLEGAITRLTKTVSLKHQGNGSLLLSGPHGQSLFVPGQDKLTFSPLSRPATPEFEGVHIWLDDNDHIRGFETPDGMAFYERASWLHKPSTVTFWAWLCGLSSLLCLMSFGRQSSNLNRPTDAQIRASWISYAISLCWLLSFWAFTSWFKGNQIDPAFVLVNWPNGQVRLASLLAAIASLATLYQIGSLYWVYQPAYHYNDGWTSLQKAGHGLVLLVSSALVIVLTAWGALEFWSW